MERCAGLIQKLQDDYRNGAPPEQLLATLQILQKELSGYASYGHYKKSTKVTVVMPNLFQEYPIDSPNAEKPQDIKNLHDNKETEPSNGTQPETNPVVVPELQKLILVDESDDEDEAEYANIPVIAQQQTENIVIMETGQEKKPDLHEQLLFSNTELADSLKEAPLKDLKKGIGINDRFLFINELFRGDEVMYERSIRTINSFNIYPEAQYWIERELKIKLGWDNENENIQLFYNLVKRRFSAM
jgi:hypothetical protein